MNPIEGKYLGKASPQPEGYAPDLLLAVPRKLNRQLYDLREEKLPFKGVDVWHAYELSFLTEKGLPVTGLLKVIYPADSPFLVESKSLKLYLNSYNMERLGKSTKEGLDLVLRMIKDDLTKALHTEVLVHFFDQQSATPLFDFADYSILENCPKMETITFTRYRESPQLLMPGIAYEEPMKTGSHLLRSNCKITHQPDWGSVYIYLEGAIKPSPEGLLQYLVSMRHEDHFHEEICELIYKRLWEAFSPSALMVACLYTRRGGVDICPVRVSHQQLLPAALTDINLLSSKLLRQ